MLPIQLSRLPQKHIEGMIQRVAGKGLPDEVVQQLIAKSDGVPLYIEEMTKNLLESGLLKETNGHFEVTGPLPQLAIPTTLQDSFASRLDRLAPVRELAQIGAVLGREFSYDLIHAVAKLDEATLQQGLLQLGTADILYQRGVPPQATYSFKHALLQDASYESLLKSKRQQLHTQTALVLEQQFRETVETHPELIAHHYTEASLAEQAIPYWQKAGQQAVQRSAHIEAANHFTSGIELLNTLAETSERAQQELAFQIALGVPLIATRGYGVPEVEKTFARARELTTQLGETKQTISILHGIRAFHLLRAELKTAHEIAEEILNIPQHKNDSTPLQLRQTLLAESLYYLGEFASARAHMEGTLALDTPELHRPDTSLWINLGASSHSYFAHILWHLGYPAQALQRSKQALALAQQLNHPFTQAALTHLHRREGQTCEELAEQAIRISQENGLPSWLALGTMLLG